MTLDRGDELWAVFDEGKKALVHEGPNEPEQRCSVLDLRSGARTPLCRWSWRRLAPAEAARELPSPNAGFRLLHIHGHRAWFLRERHDGVVELALHDLDDGRELSSIPSERRPFDHGAVKFDRAGRLMAGPGVSLIELDTGKVLLQKTPPAFRAFALSSDGSRFAALIEAKDGLSTEAQVWDTADLQTPDVPARWSKRLLAYPRLNRRTGHSDLLAFTSDSKILGISYLTNSLSSRQVKAWDYAAGGMLKEETLPTWPLLGGGAAAERICAVADEEGCYRLTPLFAVAPSFTIVKPKWTPESNWSLRNPSAADRAEDRFKLTLLGDGEWIGSGLGGSPKVAEWERWIDQNSPAWVPKFGGQRRRVAFHRWGEADPEAVGSLGQVLPSPMPTGFVATYESGDTWLWPLPLERPWPKIFGYALFAPAFLGLGFAGVSLLRRRRMRQPDA